LEPKTLAPHTSFMLLPGKSFCPGKGEGQTTLSFKQVRFYFMEPVTDRSQVLSLCTHENSLSHLPEYHHPYLLPSPSYMRDSAQVFIYLFIYLALGFELRASHLLGRRSYSLSHYTSPCSPSFFPGRTLPGHRHFLDTTKVTALA
jgi:hypothetical protein